MGKVPFWEHLKPPKNRNRRKANKQNKKWAFQKNKYLCVKLRRTIEYFKMNKHIHNVFCMAILLATIIPFTTSAQDVESFFKEMKDRFKDPLKISGGISANTLFSQTQGIESRATPFTWSLNANLNFDIIGIKTPFSAIISDGNVAYNYKLPSYRFVGLSPSYKWVTTHFGDRSMTFSPYTLSGHGFRGTGIELKPKNFRFSAMYGRLRRAVPEDLNNANSIEPAYKRMGWGFKTGFDNGKDKAEFTLFKGRDDENSIPLPLQTTHVKPSDNLVLSFSGQKQLGERLSLSLEYALSGLTRDQNSPPDGTSKKVFLGLLEENISTGYYNAVKGSIGFKASKTTNLQFNYERIDPGYRTLGALFFNDDMENFTASTTTALFDKKVNLAANMGVQRNNLSGQEGSSNGRFIGALNLAYTINKDMAVNANYSNFRNTSRLKTLTNPIAPVDSIVLAQVNQNAMLAWTYKMGDKKNKALMAMFSYQNANSIENDEVQVDQQTTFYLSNLAYTHSFQESGLSLSSSLMGNWGIVPNLETFTFAPGVSASKPFFDKQLNCSSSLSYSSVFTNGAFSNGIFSLSANAGYTLMKKHSLSLNLNLINRSSKSGNAGTAVAFTEFRGGLSYQYSFNWSLKNKGKE
jgi:hypothetical protein